MDETDDLFALSEDESYMDGWSLVLPTPKALPSPVGVSRSDLPRIRSPFQVHELVAPSGEASTKPQPKSGPLAVSAGLSRPAQMERDIQSLPYPDVHSDFKGSIGLPAPQFSLPPPSSLLHDAEHSESLEQFGFSSNQKPGLAPQQKLPSGHRLESAPQSSKRTSNLTRVRLAAKSPLVWQLWIQFVAALQHVSPVLQQMASSKFYTEHAERFLNQFAATTLMRYMQTVLQFLKLCKDLHIHIQDLSEVQLADILVCGSLARRSDGSGPKHSVTVKALRWCVKQLGVQIFSPAFGAMIASFERQKIPADRKESLPYPLFIIMKWERRILQAQASLQEILILGGFLLLCWSGLRFSDLQRSQLSSWVLDKDSLRGLTWRAKTCSTATPFGVCIHGLLSQGNWTWVHKYLQTLDRLYGDQDPDQIDFAIPSFQHRDQPCIPFDAMTYSEALYYARFYMQLPWSPNASQLQVDPSSYTIHGLKATLLSWAAQTDISPEDRRMHGKHKPSQMSVQLYSRDDIIGSLRLQTSLISRIEQGWRPTTPLGRGGQAPLMEPIFQLERFKKMVDSLEWRFFRFNLESKLQVLVDESTQEQALELSSDDSSGSSSSESTTSSDASDTVQRPVKKQRAQAKISTQIAEESVFGLHRNTWHVMVAADTGPPDELPCWQGIALKTACGRTLHHTRIQVDMEIHLTDGRSLCSHVGCRKGFVSVGVLD